MLVVLVLLKVLLRLAAAERANTPIATHFYQMYHTRSDAGLACGGTNRKHLRAPTLRSSFFTLQEATSITSVFSAILRYNSEAKRRRG